MLSYDDMPEDARDLAKIKVGFPRMEPDSEGSSPATMDQIKTYLEMESLAGEAVWRAKLDFLRTAHVGTKRYWIWEFFEADGRQCYVTVSADLLGRVTIGYDENWAKLTPEQFMLSDYYSDWATSHNRSGAGERPLPTSAAIHILEGCLKSLPAFASAGDVFEDHGWQLVKERGDAYRLWQADPDDLVPYGLVSLEPRLRTCLFIERPDVAALCATMHDCLTRDYGAAQIDPLSEAKSWELNQLPGTPRVFCERHGSRPNFAGFRIVVAVSAS